MRRVRSTGTAPEIRLRRALSAAGLRFRTHSANLPGKPDIVIHSRRLAIFIDGDFWHGGQWTRRKLAALEDQFRHTASRDYWLRKIRRNMDRDCRATAALAAAGWSVIRFWESEIRSDLDRCVARVLDARPAAPVAAGKTFAEFFAGIGLVRLALERHGWTAAYANDIDPKKLEMYRTHFGSGFDARDIHDVAPGEIPTVTLATASFPCNDLSLAGSRAGLHGRHSGAFWGLVDLLAGMGPRRPPLALLENVAGFLTSGLEEALLALNALGYAVDAFLLDAVHFVPQSRKRLFVVAQPPGESAEPRESEVRPKALVDFIERRPQIRWRIRNLPPPPRSTQRLRDILDRKAEWWPAGRAAYLLNQMSPAHRAVADQMIAGRVFTYGTVFRRMRHGVSTAELRADGIAGCLRTPRGGSARQILFKAGRGKYFARLLTPRECARLMGAGGYRIECRPNQALFGFGDAVCVPVIEWIAGNYLNPLVCELIHSSGDLPQSSS
jgi:DNA (cytosine-5)-methyltransferase 1